MNSCRQKKKSEIQLHIIFTVIFGSIKKHQHFCVVNVTQSDKMPKPKINLQKKKQIQKITPATKWKENQVINLMLFVVSLQILLCHCIPLTRTTKQKVTN